MSEHGICPRYHKAVEIIGRRWNGAILQAMSGGAVRFGEVANQVPGLSDRMLSERLKELEGEGLVQRTVYPETPVRVEYTLTPMGKSLKPVLRSIGKWAATWVEVTS